MDNLTVQYLIIALIVAVALYYFINKMRKSFQGESSCNKGCGCSIDKSSTSDSCQK